MRILRLPQQLPALGCLLLLAAAIWWGCNSAPTSTTFPAEYRIDGTAIIDLNVDSTRIVFLAAKNDTVTATATMSLNGTPLQFTVAGYGLDSIFTQITGSAFTYPRGSYLFVFANGGDFVDTFLFTIPDSLTDSVVSPGNRLILGNGSASLDWSVAFDADGYVMAAVKQDSAYAGTGFSTTSGIVGTEGTIPPDAFLSDDGFAPDTGLYNIYVYAYRGRPDSVLTSLLLPVPLPFQSADNIATNQVAGRVGSVIVAKMDTVRVALQN